LSVCLGAALLLPVPAFAQSVDDLMGVIRAQAARIDALEQRLKVLEGSGGASSATPAAPAASAEDTNAAAAETETVAAGSADAGSPGDLVVTWKGAPEISSADGRYSFKPRGRVQADAWWVESGQPGVDYGSGTEVRRARLGVEGKFDRFQYKIEVDFAGEGVSLQDVKLSTPVARQTTLTLGYHKSPITLEDQTDDNDVTFMERTAYASTMAPGRGIGASLRYAGADWMIGGGAFGENENDTPDGSADEDWLVAGRVTYGPALGATNRLHVGLSGYYREVSSDNPAWRLRARPGFHLAPRLVDTNSFPGSAVRFLGAEMAWLSGPLHASGEWGRQWVSRPDTDDTLMFEGGYAQIGWFLTGEERPYKAAAGKFGRVAPAAPLGEGWGALEVAARYAALDLVDGDIAGGTLTEYALGLNWYLHEHVRLMANWVHFDVEQSLAGMPLGVTSHEGDAFGLRAQVDW